jgi:NTE family protein
MDRSLPDAAVHPLLSGGNAVVLGGGGSAGIAWELGFLAGVEEVHPELLEELRGAGTTLIGTSAGSIVGAQLRSNLTMAELVAPELAFVAQSKPSRAGLLRLVRLTASMLMAGVGARDPAARRRRIGKLAVRGGALSSTRWRSTIEDRLVLREWPEHPLLVTATDTATGELRVFERDSGVDFVDAVAASCAVPGIYPPVSIGGALYMDGGMRSIANADLAAGADRVLILAPLLRSSGMGSLSAAELAALSDARVLTIDADKASRRAFGRNPLDASTRPTSAAAGMAQGRAAAADIARFLRGTAD